MNNTIDTTKILNSISIQENYIEIIRERIKLPYINLGIYEPPYYDEINLCFGFISKSDHNSYLILIDITNELITYQISTSSDIISSLSKIFDINFYIPTDEIDFKDFINNNII